MRWIIRRSSRRDSAFGSTIFEVLYAGRTWASGAACQNKNIASQRRRIARARSMQANAIFEVPIMIPTPAVAHSVRGRRMKTQVEQVVDGKIDAPGTHSQWRAAEPGSQCPMRMTRSPSRRT
jgi:hypothetical protein